MAYTEIKDSSALAGYSYENGVLTVRSTQGKEYPYADVTQEEYEAFVSAPSKGRAWGEIKKKHKLA